GYRRTALGKFDEAVVQALYKYAVDGLLRAGRALFGLLGYLVEDGLFLRPAYARKLVLHAVDAAHSGLAAVADGGEELVQAGYGELLEYLRQHVLVRDVGHSEAAAPELRVEHIPSALDVLLAPLLLEPLLYLCARTG